MFRKSCPKAVTCFLPFSRLNPCTRLLSIFCSLEPHLKLHMTATVPLLFQLGKPCYGHVKDPSKGGKKRKRPCWKKGRRQKKSRRILLSVIKRERFGGLGWRPEASEKAREEKKRKEWVRREVEGKLCLGARNPPLYFSQFSIYSSFWLAKFID